MNKRLPLAAALACLCAFLAAQEPVEEPSNAPEDVKARMERARELERQYQDRWMRNLQKTNPGQYQQLTQVRSKQSKMASILAKAKAGEISGDEAKAQLMPLVKEKMQSELDGLDERVARLQKRLAYLKRAQKNPDLLVEDRVSQMLSERQPDAGQAPSGDECGTPGPVP